MFTFLHAADIHLDSPLLNLEQYEGAPVEAIRGATRRAMENLVELAISKPVDFVLISGDLYDGDWKDYNTGLYFVSQMSRLREAGIPVFLIAGNHDAASRMTKTLRLPDNVRMFPSNHSDTFFFDDLRVAVHGQGFSAPAVKKNLVLEYPEPVSGYFNIGMLHTCAGGREGHEPYAPCSIEDMISKGYEYWALGHVHQREILHENPMIVFPGNIQGRHVRETGAKGCMIVEADDDGNSVMDFYALDVFRWENAEIDISEAQDAYEAVEIVCRHLSACMEENDGLPLAARLALTGKSPAHKSLSAKPEYWIQQIRSAVLDSCSGQIWIEKVRLRTMEPVKENKTPDGPVGEILEFFDDLRSDPELLEPLSKSLNPIYTKLPRELKDRPDILRPEDYAWLGEILESVHPMLLNRLMFKGEEL